MQEQMEKLMLQVGYDPKQIPEDIEGAPLETVNKIMRMMGSLARAHDLSMRALKSEIHDFRGVKAGLTNQFERRWGEMVGKLGDWYLANAEQQSARLAHGKIGFTDQQDLIDIDDAKTEDIIKFAIDNGLLGWLKIELRPIEIKKWMKASKKNKVDGVKLVKRPPKFYVDLKGVTRKGEVKHADSDSERAGDTLADEPTEKRVEEPSAEPPAQEERDAVRDDSNKAGEVHPPDATEPDPVDSDEVEPDASDEDSGAADNPAENEDDVPEKGGSGVPDGIVSDDGDDESGEVNTPEESSSDPGDGVVGDDEPEPEDEEPEADSSAYPEEWDSLTKRELLAMLKQEFEKREIPKEERFGVVADISGIEGITPKDPRLTVGVVKQVLFGVTEMGLPDGVEDEDEEPQPDIDLMTPDQFVKECEDAINDCNTMREAGSRGEALAKKFCEQLENMIESVKKTGDVSGAQKHTLHNIRVALSGWK